VCDSLSELREALCSYTARLDVALVAPSQLGPALACSGAIEKAASGLASMLAARMASGAGTPGSGLAGSHGARLAAEAFAKAAGTSLGEARRAIDAGRAMTNQPELAAVVLSGRLSRQQACLVSTAAAVNPGATPGSSRRRPALRSLSWQTNAEGPEPRLKTSKLVARPCKRGGCCALGPTPTAPGTW